MSASLFLVAALPSDDRYTLDGPEGHHAATVARLRPGEELLLGDGRGGLASATVTGVGRDTLTVAVDARRYVPPADPSIVVVQALAKGERGERAVQAMTEAGVDAVVPWAAARSVVVWRGERGERAGRRWSDIAREAAKQARRPWLPQVPAAAESTAAVAARLRAAATALVLHEEATERLTTARLPERGEVVVVVGPEGGVTPAEVATFEAAGARPVRLGPSILRTSTAGLAAVVVLQARLGRW